MTRFVQISTTVDNRKTATEIANKLTRLRLASCVQILGPIASTYRWKGKIEHTREWLCLVKARTSDYRRIEAAIKKLHPYHLPEILGFQIQYGNPDYLKWVENETDRKSGRRRV